MSKKKKLLQSEGWVLRCRKVELYVEKLPILPSFYLEGLHTQLALDGLIDYLFPSFGLVQVPVTSVPVILREHRNEVFLFWRGNGLVRGYTIDHLCQLYHAMSLSNNASSHDFTWGSKVWWVCKCMPKFMTPTTVAKIIPQSCCHTDLNAWFIYIWSHTKLYSFWTFSFREVQAKPLVEVFLGPTFAKFLGVRSLSLVFHK